MSKNTAIRVAERQVGKDTAYGKRKHTRCKTTPDDFPFHPYGELYTKARDRRDEKRRQQQEQDDGEITTEQREQARSTNSRQINSKKHNAKQ